MENNYREYLETFVSKFEKIISAEHCTMDLINFMVKNPSSDYLDYLRYCEEKNESFCISHGMEPMEILFEFSLDKWLENNYLSYNEWIDEKIK